MNKLIAGVYGIEDVRTGNIYIGSADSDNGIKKRWSCHKAHLRKNEHKYKELQEAFSDDKSRIKWIILEECYDDSELEERENYWIEHADRVEGWNVINKEQKSKKRTKVADKTKMKEAQTGESNGHNTKLCIEDVKEIKKMLKDKVKQSLIADKFGVSQTLIYNIKNGVRWASVEV